MSATQNIHQDSIRQVSLVAMEEAYTREAGLFASFVPAALTEGNMQVAVTLPITSALGDSLCTDSPDAAVFQGLRKLVDTVLLIARAPVDLVER